MGYREFGNILKQVREYKGLTIVDLEQISGVSKRHIYRIEKDGVYSTIHTTSCLSNALGINLSDYMNVYNEFNSVEEYEEYCHIRKIIETKDEEELRKIVNKYLTVDINKLPQSTFKQVLLYAFGTFYTSRGNYDQSQSYLFKALGTEEYLFEIQDIRKLISTEFTFVIYTLIEYNYFMLKKPKKALRLAKEVIEAIEDFYFSKNLARNTVPKIIIRSYINLSNNIADNYFENKEYEKSIEYCEKITEYIKSEDKNFYIEWIHLLLFKNYDGLGDFNKAYTNLENSFLYAYLKNQNKFIEKILEYVEGEYKDYKEKFENNLGSFLKKI